MPEDAATGLADWSISWFTRLVLYFAGCRTAAGRVTKMNGKEHAVNENWNCENREDEAFRRTRMYCSILIQLALNAGFRKA